MYLITGTLGLAFMAAPYIFGYSQNSLAMWTSVILGGAATLVSVIEGIDRDKDQWEYKVVEIIGLIAIVAPFVMGFSSVDVAMWTCVVMGIVLTLIVSVRLYFNQPDQDVFRKDDKYFGYGI